MNTQWGMEQNITFNYTITLVFGSVWNKNTYIQLQTISEVNGTKKHTTTQRRTRWCNMFKCRMRHQVVRCTEIPRHQFTAHMLTLHH